MLGRFRHIVVEGPIGAGKTSLARKLAVRMGADLALENADENPFLPRFYEDRKRYALPVQLFFLLPGWSRSVDSVRVNCSRPRRWRTSCWTRICCSPA